MKNHHENMFSIYYAWFSVLLVLWSHFGSVNDSTAHLQKINCPLVLLQNY